MAHPYWPLFDLEVRTPRLTLRYIDDELGAEVATVALAGIHDTDYMPFAAPWTDAPRDQIAANSFRFWWQCRADMNPERWDLPLAVIVDGTVVGASGIGARDFPVRRWVETGSWLGRLHQAQGLGTELRVATLHLGFVAFGALVAGTGAFSDNAPSLGVTRKLGYEPNGVEHHVRRGELGVIERYRMTREHFDARVRRDDVEIVGDEPVRELLGISR